MKPNLLFLAGSKAIRRIKQDGLQPDTVKMVAGAAGGPKWLTLSQLDRAIFPQFLAQRKTPLFLIGSSIGTWRFAAVSRKDPTAAIAAFEEAYIEQRFKEKPTPPEVSAVSLNVLQQVVNEQTLDEILTHPHYRLNIVTARGRAALSSEHKAWQAIGLAAAIAGNMAHTSALQLFFRRAVFSDPRQQPDFLTSKSYPCDVISLTRTNATSALLASGSIPLIMAGVADIPGAPHGVYRDGGIIDYHMNLPFLDQRSDDIVLMPHFGHKIIPGWFDKSLPWRKANADSLEHVLLICPTPEFISKLPFGKIPDRIDFTNFIGHDKERIAYWRKVVKECERLKDEFLELMSAQKLDQHLQSF